MTKKNYEYLVDRELDELFTKTTKKLEQLLNKVKAQRIAREKPRLIRFGLREPEAEAWLKQEPDFPRDIRRFFPPRRSDADFTVPARWVLVPLRLID
jgi:hypothetical protein